MNGGADFYGKNPAELRSEFNMSLEIFLAVCKQKSLESRRQFAEKLDLNQGNKMAVYVIADIEVLDPALFEEYRQKVPATIAAYGGRYVARGGHTEVLEGSWEPKRCVVLEFPDMERFKTWWSSPEYAPLRALRQRASNSSLVVTQGL